MLRRFRHFCRSLCIVVSSKNINYSFNWSNMDLYKEVLILIQKLLLESNNNRWSDLLNISIQDWGNHKSVKHHLGLFGGMGSIGDQSIECKNIDPIWLNNVYESLVTLSWKLARNKGNSAKIDISNTISKSFLSLSSISTVECESCQGKFIPNYEVEHFISKRTLPIEITELISKDLFKEILNIEKLKNSSESKRLRNSIDQLLRQKRIAKTEKYSLHKCPECGESKLTRFYWEPKFIDGKLYFEEEKGKGCLLTTFMLLLFIIIIVIFIVNC